MGDRVSAANIRVLLLLVLLLASWLYIGQHWLSEHGPRSAAAPAARPAQVERPITSVTAIGELPQAATFSPAPDFVSRLDAVPRGEEMYEAENGVRYVLYQVEHDVLDMDPRRYVRMISEPVSTAGIDRTANVNLVFNPAYETLEFHSLSVERDGVVEDRTSTTTIEFARRETQLERRMFDGRATAIVRFSDIRIGDRVEYSYTVTGRNPAVRDNDSRSFSIGFGAPVERMFIRSSWSEHAPVSHQLLGPDPVEQPAFGIREGNQSISFGPVATPPFPGERGSPTWVRQLPTLQVTDYQNWYEVSRWSEPYYEPQLSAPVIEIAERIRAQYETHDAQLIAALRFVQDEVRYLAISFGAGGYVPASPDDTLERRYGDCKAKTVLLISLLDSLGIEAEAVLVHTTRGHGLLEALPSHLAFNHVIVRAFIDGNAYWLDGTKREQGGDLQVLTQPDFGHALPVGDNGFALVRMQAPDTDEPLIFSSEELVVQSVAGNAVFNLEFVGRGDGADQLRANLSQSGRADLEEQLRDFYSTRYGAVTPSSGLIVEDDREANLVRWSMTFEVDNVLSEHEDGSRQRIAGLARLRAPTQIRAERDRVFPLSLGAPHRQRARVILHLPDEMADWTLEPAPRVLDADGLSFSLEQARDGTRYILDYELLVTRRVVEAEVADTVLDASDQIRRLARWTLLPPDAR